MNPEVVDYVGIDLNGDVVLTVSDHLIWDDKNEHLLALQNKINAYLAFMEKGNLYEEYPDAKDRNIVISIVAQYEPNDTAKIFLDRIGETLESAGYELRFRVFRDS